MMNSLQPVPVGAANAAIRWKLQLKLIWQQTLSRSGNNPGQFFNF